MKNRYAVLFVCLGNICRSPAAESILRHLAEQRGVADCLEIDSAGTYGGHAGEPSDDRMRRAAWVRGYPMIHRARQVREEDFERFDRIVAMDDRNYENLWRLAPSREEGHKIVRMASYFTSFGEWSYVPDPYYEGHEGFERVLDMLEEGCAALLDEIEKINR